MTTFRLALPLLAVVLSAASCDKRPTFADWETQTWATTCAADSDCVLVQIPCDPCGGELSVSTHERAKYDEYTGNVSCDDYPHEDDCGESAPMEPACVSGQCTARIARSVQDEMCATLRERAAALLATPSAPCESDADCACYPAFVDCGGVRDAAFAAAFTEIAREGEACGYVSPEGAAFNCAPWACTPTCTEGNCVR